MKRYLHMLMAFLLLGCFSSPVSALEMNSPSPLQALGISAIHQNGQTFVTWQEVSPIIPLDAPTGKEFYGYKNTAPQRILYNIYFSPNPISSVDGIKPQATVHSLSGWDQNAYGVDTGTSDKIIHRYVISNDGIPLPNGTGLWVHNPDWTGTTYYAVTAVVNGIENKTVTPDNSLAAPVLETTGSGKPILQRIEKPEFFMGVNNTQVYYYTRWEAPPNCRIEGKAFDYLVGIPPNLADPAPVGMHMHGWGGSEETGYSYWNDSEDGSILLASNQDPYDWWTGYQENPMGVVHPYTANRLFSFLYWMQEDTQWKIDLHRTFTAGSSMGGSGSMMTGIRNGGRIAWVRSNVGVHVPAETTRMKSTYAANYGNPEAGVLFENGTPVWNYYDDVWFLRQYPTKEVPFLAFANGKNDPLIDWPQAVHFYQALQDTKRPHLFVWGQDGHGQTAKMPMNGTEQTMPIDIRVDQSLPAFTHCSLDDNPGNGNPFDGAAQGQINGYLYWETADITDTKDSWEITVGLTEKAPQDSCTVDITARRLQNFSAFNGWPIKWENRDLKSGTIIASGTIRSDSNGLYTVPQITVSKTKNRIILSK